MTTPNAASSEAWTLIEKEKRRDRFIRRVSIAAWTVTFLILLVFTVMIGGHVAPDTMTFIAEMGRGRFYDVRSPAQLPQIFIKEAAVILKSAIFEEPFKPQVASSSELIRGISGAEMPPLLGYVATSVKPRAETPIMSEKGDPVLAHWQYGLGRAVAFTSDAEEARTFGRAFLEHYLERPNYANSLRRLGFTEDDLVGGGSDRLVDALVAHGSEELIAARLREHRETGADSVCVQVVSGGDMGGMVDLHRDVWRGLAPALTAVEQGG